MQEKIKKILERELTKLETLSAVTLEPLHTSDIKSLDLLIRAYRSFTAPNPDPPASNPADPANQSTESLLQSLNDSK